MKKSSVLIGVLFLLVAAIMVISNRQSRTITSATTTTQAVGPATNEPQTNGTLHFEGLHVNPKIQ